jgi:hypothetical protein
MTADAALEELNRLGQASERVAANLVELEIDSSRQLLEASTLSGQSAARWSSASATLTDLWEWRGLLDAFLERAQELSRSSRRRDELRAWLAGPSIELARSQVPLAERHLLGTAERRVRCTADELLEHMSRAFDEVNAVVARFGTAWGTLSPRLAEARAALDGAQTLAATLGEPTGHELTAAGARITELTNTLSSDPLAVAPDELARLIDSLHDVKRDLDATAGLRRELETRLGECRARLMRLQALLDEGRAAHEELLVKISVPSAPAAPDLPSGLRPEVDQIAALAASGAWREARLRLDAWTDETAALLADAERILGANRAPLEARNQLRALLEAYQVKASRLGALEDPELERVFAQAQESLYTAPTDLAFAAQLVRRYQETLTAAQEVVR